jgi:hypothetical protein
MIDRRDFGSAVTALGVASLVGCRPHGVTGNAALTIDLPLLDEFLALDEKIRKRFPSEYKWDEGLKAVGACFEKPSNVEVGGYWCSPTNVATFAQTGGDGAYYSFLVHAQRIDPDSPVILTIPDNFGEPEDANLIVGDGFRNFVRFGLRRGYFAMSQLAFNREQALADYATEGDWPEDREKEILKLIADSLNLTPLAYTADEFESLQARFRHKLTFKPEAKR